MTDNDNFFVEVDSCQLCEAGQNVSGDVCLHHKTEDRIITVLSDGAGSGVGASVVASVIASMVISYARLDEDMMRAARTVIGTFARGDRLSDLRQATFTIVNITPYDGVVRIVEFENPRVVVMRGDGIVCLPRRRQPVDCPDGSTIDIFITKFTATVEDRIVAYTDGVIQSGAGSRRMPDGWGESGVAETLMWSVATEPDISAGELARRVVSHAETNDLFAVKNDMSCTVVYFRRPRKVLVVTGPPFDSDKDAMLAERVRSFDGKVIVSGGTTAQILSRELGREVSQVLRRDPSGLPPESTMEGCALVTEGVLTLGRVKGLLDTMKSSHIEPKGIDSRYAALLLDGDQIEFIVGTRVNTSHHDPNLPVEIELRRGVVRDIARTLETKFMKRVSISYI